MTGPEQVLGYEVWETKQYGDRVTVEPWRHYGTNHVLVYVSKSEAEIAIEHLDKLLGCDGPKPRRFLRPVLLFPV